MFEIIYATRGGGREVCHSPPSSAKIKNVWRRTSATQYVFMAWFLVKHSQLYFYFTVVKVLVLIFFSI